MENVSKMIEALDEAAKPVSQVEVVTLKGNVNAERVRKVLAGMLGEKIVQPGQGGAANQPPGGPQPGQPGGPQARGRPRRLIAAFSPSDSPPSRSPRSRFLTAGRPGPS